MDEETQRPLLRAPSTRRTFCADIVACCIRCERLCLVIVPICAAAMIISGATALLLLFGPRIQ